LAQDRAQVEKSPTAAVVGSGVAPTIPLAVIEEKPPDGILPANRAWEWNHYRVRVWLCSDGSPSVASWMPKLVEQVSREATMIDPSGWEVFVSQAPNPWFWRCGKNFDHPELLKGIETIPQLKFDDKLIMVHLRDVGNGIECRARELDLATRQWGAVQTRLTSQLENLTQLVTDSVRFAFMPLARIESVPTDDTIVLRSRATEACIQAYMDEQLNWVTKFNQGSPVAINSNDNFVPVLRKVDRSGKLESLESITFTFINVDKVEGTKVTGFVHTMMRAPLSGRTSKRLQKLALVIRPQPGTTTLRLYAADDPKIPMEGLEVFSRNPDWKKDDPMDLIGKTDWRGVVEIPPGVEPLRLIYLKRGARAMKKIPIISGFQSQLATEVGNDEARLFAEGVILGVQTEILDLVVQRADYEARIAAALEKNNFDIARRDLENYQRLPNAEKLVSTLADEEARLDVQAKSKKEKDFIKSMFSKVREVVQTRVANSREVELREKIQNAGSSPQ
jgi:hypothetical protein